MCEPLAPWPSVPVSKLPSFAVAVWSAESAFVQVTVSPVWTVIPPGWKAKPWMFTPPDAAARAIGGEDVATRGAGGGGAAVVVGGGASEVVVGGGDLAGGEHLGP